jgi:hypothetical protein
LAGGVHLQGKKAPQDLQAAVAWVWTGRTVTAAAVRMANRDFFISDS